MRYMLETSKQDGLVLEIIYQAENGNLSQRKIKVKSYNESHFIAYCFERKKTRMFRLDRLLSIAPLNKVQ
ncbi:hypothetical protein [Bacillus sp. JCM 19034]|uniref:WYL domain-containing protein n=1 Tax=Bacillus sp. JCM 19034 TaxID=1481928 RepID=UPI000783811B|nr:hypothetical protein [Bacillus sp. JCM 19034]